MDDADEPGPSTNSNHQDEPEPDEVKPKLEELDEMDPSLAEWFKIDEKKAFPGINAGNDSDTETDEDSDNADVADGDDADDLDDWLKVKPVSDSGGGRVEDTTKVGDSCFQGFDCVDHPNLISLSGGGCGCQDGRE